MEICNIKWLSKEACEAEVVVTDGKYELKCFSQPLKYDLNEQLREALYCYNVKSVFKSTIDNFEVVKLSEYFAYNITALLICKNRGLIKLGRITLEVDKETIPSDIKDDDYIVFYCQRIDVM